MCENGGYTRERRRGGKGTGETDKMTMTSQKGETQTKFQKEKEGRLPEEKASIENFPWEVGVSRGGESCGVFRKSPTKHSEKRKENRLGCPGGQWSEERVYGKSN